jgi:HNH endonuclease
MATKKTRSKRNKVADKAQSPRTRRVELKVCKPCWELHYCPYGGLVEYFPIVNPDGREETWDELWARYDLLIAQFVNGEFKTPMDVEAAIARFMYLSPHSWDEIRGRDPDEITCKLWGHICPVFVTADNCGETKQRRRHSRYVPQGMMLKVVRRDGQICQMCQHSVPDDQVEFDHVIPFSKGGPTQADNIRLVCRTCNRKKMDKFNDRLDPHF